MPDSQIYSDRLDAVLGSHEVRNYRDSHPSVASKIMAMRLAFLATTSLVLATAKPVLAAPQGGMVVAGHAEIKQNGNVTQIDQSTQRAAINWQSFNVAGHEIVNFTVPNHGATLNRVVGLDPSRIDGTIQSNGTVYLINPNGMVFSSGSKVTAQNFVASTAVISPEDFMAGRGNFNQKSGKSDAKLACPARSRRPITAW